MKNSEAKLPETRQDAPDILQESRQQPIWHVFVLGILTMSAYLVVWFYKNIRELHDYAKLVDAKEAPPPNQQEALLKFKKASPILLAVGLIIPVLQIFLAVRFFKQCAELHPERETVMRRHPWLCGLGVTLALALLLHLARLPGPLFLLYLTAILPIALVQSWLNDLWKSVEPNGLIVRHAFSIGELVSIIVGSMLLGVVVVGFSFGH